MEWANNIDFSGLAKVGAAIADILTPVFVVIGLLMFLSAIYGIFVGDPAKSGSDPTSHLIGEVVKGIFAVLVGALGPWLKAMFEGMAG